jgi:excinuclease ABC subunit B
VPAFKVISDFEPAGDQPKAIEKLAEGITRGDRFQTLLGITGSGKSATMAWTIESVQKPTLVIAPNKALAAQLANEFRQLFIEKDATVNDEIDRLRHAATAGLLVRNDVIIVASLSCIDPDHRAGGPKRRRSGGHVRRQHHRLDEACHL